MGCLAAPRVTHLFVSQQLTWCVHFVIHSSNTEFKIEYLKYFIFQKYTKYLWEDWKMYNLKNVIYKGSCLPARVLLPRNLLISLVLSWGGNVGLWKMIVKSLSCLEENNHFYILCKTFYIFRSFKWALHTVSVNVGAWKHFAVFFELGYESNLLC